MIPFHFSFFPVTTSACCCTLQVLQCADMKNISTSNHMFVRAIWNKSTECIFENLKIYKLESGKLYSNSINGAMVITMSLVKIIL